jgi:2-C-methyl-D-erythritol 4-phosphate cytidylyltransferase
MTSAVVLAAGRSTRMGGSTNKQFIELAGKPLIFYSLAAFQASPVDEIVLVTWPEHRENAQKIVKKFGFSKVKKYADGGKERQNSVKNGLDACDSRTEIVAVHDGARPLVTPELISATISSAKTHGSGVAATKIVDTVKEVGENFTVSRTIDRTKLWAVQTPQTFSYKILREAYEKVFEKSLVVTDEAAAVELLGKPVRLVATTFFNVKVTMPADLAIAEALLRARR